MFGARGAGTLLLAMAVATGVAGCGDADNEYVANNDAGLFVRLPADWTVYQVADNNPAADPRTDADAGRWRVVFDASESPTRAHLDQLVPDAPVGFVEIVPTALLEGAQLTSHAALRSMLLAGQGDPLDPSIDVDVEVLDYEEVDLGHHWGNRIVAEMPAPGLENVIITQLAYLDSASNRVHVLRVVCSTTCYEAREDEINEVVDSWTLEDR
jgi:hypothetical protein